MAFDAFMNIDGIKGDSQDSKHKGWIEIDSFTHGVKQATGGSTSAHGGPTGGRADHSDFTITKLLDSASPVLEKYCCDAKPIAKIEFVCCRATGDKQVFYKVTLTDCIVSGVAATGKGEGEDLIPMEEINFRFATINWEYTPTDEKGKAGAAIKAGWSTRENKPL
ncbi:MAG: Hcp family type VI secretion system effector [Phycisphaerales bacterium]